MSEQDPSLHQMFYLSTSHYSISLNSFVHIQMQIRPGPPLIIMEEEKKFVWNPFLITAPQIATSEKILRSYPFYLDSFWILHICLPLSQHPVNSLNTVNLNLSDANIINMIIFSFIPWSIYSLLWFLSIHTLLLFPTPDVWVTVCPWTYKQNIWKDKMS